MTCYTKSDRIISEVSDSYKNILTTFTQLTAKDCKEQITFAQDLFLQIAVPSEQFLKNLHRDLRFISKEMKRLKKIGEPIDALQNLHKNLSDLLAYLKKHKLQYDVVIFHKDVNNRWGFLFKAITDGNDDEQLLKMVDQTQRDVDGFKTLLKNIEKDQRKVDEYEYRLHTDLIELKLENYVLKIELIRLRNSVLFHPLYKGTKLHLPSSYPR